MIQLSQEQIEAFRNGQLVRLPVPELGNEVVLLGADEYARLQMLLEDAWENSAWADLGRKTAEEWEKGLPF